MHEIKIRALTPALADVVASWHMLRVPAPSSLHANCNVASVIRCVGPQPAREWVPVPPAERALLLSLWSQILPVIADATDFAVVKLLCRWMRPRGMWCSKTASNNLGPAQLDSPWVSGVPLCYHEPFAESWWWGVYQLSRRNTNPPQREMMVVPDLQTPAGAGALESAARHHFVVVGAVPADEKRSAIAAETFQALHFVRPGQESVVIQGSTAMCEYRYLTADDRAIVRNAATANVHVICFNKFPADRDPHDAHAWRCASASANAADRGTQGLPGMPWDEPAARHPPAITTHFKGTRAHTLVITWDTEESLSAVAEVLRNQLEQRTVVKLWLVGCDALSARRLVRSATLGA